MTTRLYKLFCPAQSTLTAADTIFFDLFNIATSGLNLHVHHIIPQYSGDVAVTGTLAADMSLQKTSAVGTGGTEATSEGTGYVAMTFSAYGHSLPMDVAKVSARLTPTGGATSAGTLGWTSTFTEETNDASYMGNDLVKRGNTTVPPLFVKPGTGVKVVQGSVAVSGNIGFDILFSTTKK